MPPTSKTDKGLGLPIKSEVDRNAEIEIIYPEENYVVYFINENSLGQSPVVELKVENKFVINAILDSGSEVSLISYEVYDKLTKAGINLPALPVESVEQCY
jgi:hypothetical protein